MRRLTQLPFEFLAKLVALAAGLSIFACQAADQAESATETQPGPQSESGASKETSQEPVTAEFSTEWGARGFRPSE